MTACLWELCWNKMNTSYFSNANTLNDRQCNVILYSQLHLHLTVYIYTGCPRGNVPDFGRTFLTLKYTDITQNTYI